MKLKSLLGIAIFTLSSQACAAHLYNLTQHSLAINQCPLTKTDEHWDLALINKGFFVVSSEQNSNDHYFTRYGKLYIDDANYLRTDANDYVLGVTKKNNDLVKIKLPSRHLAPKATSAMDISVNLPSRGAKEEHYSLAFQVYDVQGNAYTAQAQCIKIANTTWNVEILNEQKAVLAKGTLEFNQSGTVSSQEGLEHVQYPVKNGTQELKIDFSKESTQYNYPFSVNALHGTGYEAGNFLYNYLSMDGEVTAVYTNGQKRSLNKRIAVALFAHPESLQALPQHLYSPTEQSGQATIYWANSERAMIEFFLEEEACLTH